MTSMPPSPPPSQPDRRPFDELIAVVVALFGIGGILAWSFSQRDAGFDLSSVLDPTASPVPPASPLISPTPAQPRAPGIISTPAPTPSARLTPVPPTPRPSVAVTPFTPVVPVPVVVPTPTDAAIVPSPEPTVSPSPVAPIGFVDVPEGYWAAPFITALAQQNIVAGFQDNTFLPNKPVTRAEFATILEKASNRPKSQASLNFTDLPAGYWAASAIDTAVQMGFLNGYPDGTFRPNQGITKAQGLVSIATGLELPAPDAPATVVQRFEDAGAILPYAVPKIAAATNAGLVANYPSTNRLLPTQVLSRADAAALIHQMLVKEGKLAPVTSQFVIQP